MHQDSFFQNLCASPGAKKPIRYACWILFFLGLVIISYTFTDYGIAFDDMEYMGYGEKVLKYYLSGFQDQSYRQGNLLWVFGPLFDALAAFFYQTWDLPKMETRHFLSACFAFLTALGVYRIARLFQSPGGAFCSALVLTLLPGFYGHAFINCKDIPFACGFCWSMYAILRIYAKDKKSFAHYLFCGLMIGLTLSIRMQAMLLLCFLVAAEFFANTILYPHIWKESVGKNLGKIALRLGSIFLISWLVLLLLWPGMAESPISVPLQSFFAGGSIGAKYTVLFEGKVYLTTELPRYYLPKTMAITLPPLLLFAFVGGVVLFCQRLIVRLKSRDSFMILMLLLWFFFPLAYVIITRPALYDGMRHFLFLLPAFAVVTGASCIYLCHRLLQKFPNKKILWLGACLLLLPMKDLVGLHPYQMTYHNAFVGGLAEAWKNYETEYWFISYKEAAEWLNAQMQEQKLQKMVVLVSANVLNRLCIAYYLNPKIEVRLDSDPLPEDFDYYVATTRGAMNGNFFRMPVVHVIGRGGGLFCVIREYPVSARTQGN